MTFLRNKLPYDWRSDFFNLAELLCDEEFLVFFLPLPFPDLPPLPFTLLPDIPPLTLPYDELAPLPTATGASTTTGAATGTLT